MFERGDVKVDEQPCRASGQSQIREQLRKVNRGEFGHALHFDDYTGVDNEIDSECPGQDQLFIRKRQILLHFYSEPALPKFHVHAGQVCRFQQPRPDYSVYFDSRPDYFACDRVDLPRICKRHGNACATVLPSCFPHGSPRLAVCYWHFLR